MKTKTVEEIVLEIKDKSELSVDLAYSSIIYFIAGKGPMAPAIFSSRLSGKFGLSALCPSSYVSLFFAF